MKSGYIVEMSTERVVGTWQKFGNVLTASADPQHFLSGILTQFKRDGLPNTQETYDVPDNWENTTFQNNPIPFETGDTIDLGRALVPEGFVLVPRKDVERLGVSDVSTQTHKQRETPSTWTDNYGYVIGPGDTTVAVWRVSGGEVVISNIIDVDLQRLIQRVRTEGIPTFNPDPPTPTESKHLRALRVDRKLWEDASPPEISMALHQHGYWLVPASEIELKPRVWR
jgi:hypothetical protein